MTPPEPDRTRPEMAPVDRMGLDQLDAQLLERVWDGSGPPEDDLPSCAREVTGLIAAARGPASADEHAGESAIVALMQREMAGQAAAPGVADLQPYPARQAGAGRVAPLPETKAARPATGGRLAETGAAAEPRHPHVRTIGRTVAVKVAAVAGGLALGAAAAAATTGVVSTVRGGSDPEPQVERDATEEAPAAGPDSRDAGARHGDQGDVRDAPRDQAGKGGSPAAGDDEMPGDGATPPDQSGSPGDSGAARGQGGPSSGGGGQRGNSGAAPGQGDDVPPGQAGRSPGQGDGSPGSGATPPGQGGWPGDSGAAPGQGGSPGDSGAARGQGGWPGDSGAARGQGGSPSGGGDRPGSRDSAPGQGGSSPGPRSSRPGQDGASGNSGVAPGRGGGPPGNIGVAPGRGGGSPAGQGGTPPGQANR